MCPRPSVVRDGTTSFDGRCTVAFEAWAARTAKGFKPRVCAIKTVLNRTGHDGLRIEKNCHQQSIHVPWDSPEEHRSPQSRAMLIVDALSLCRIFILPSGLSTAGTGASKPSTGSGYPPNATAAGPGFCGAGRASPTDCAAHGTGGCGHMGGGCAGESEGKPGRCRVCRL